MFALGLAAFTQLDYSWGLFALLFFVPDISAVGYLVNPRVGAFTYNLVHHKATAIIVYLLGVKMANPALQFAGVILFAHSSFDRILGYGLKLPESFNQTHLGPIGKASQA